MYVFTLRDIVGVKINIACAREWSEIYHICTVGIGAFKFTPDNVTKGGNGELRDFSGSFLIDCMVIRFVYINYTISLYSSNVLELIKPLLSIWSASTRATIASATGTIRGGIVGSCLPLIAISVFSWVVRSTVC